MRFVTLFPETENVHLVKDVGMIPYVMYKEYEFDSAIACYNNCSYSYINSEVQGLKLDFIKRYTGKTVIDGGLYLLRNSKKIDVLHLFHLSKRTSVWICIYKLLNPKGKVYLKLDANSGIMFSTNPNQKTLKGYIKKLVIGKCDLISAETFKIYDFIKNNWKINIEYIPNGFYDYNLKHTVEYKEKENIILTVGRIGSYEKATDVLLEGFKLASNYAKNWRLRVVGPIQDEFKEYLNVFFDKNPKMRNRVDIVGPIYDRMKLEQEYRKAKIFSLTSKYESFGLVFVEAMKNGCYIVTSNVLSANDITSNQKYGDVFEVDNYNELAKFLIRNCNNEKKLEDVCNRIQVFAYENFEWTAICKKIINHLNI